MSLIQMAVLSCVGILVGLLVGATLPLIAGDLLRNVLPVPPVSGVFPVPLALAAIFGLLTAGAFALVPLGRAM